MHTSVFKIDNKQVRESIPRQVNKKSRVPEEEKRLWGFLYGKAPGTWYLLEGLEFSRRRKGQTPFSYIP